MRTIHLCQTYGNTGHKEVRPWRTQHTDKHKPTGCGSMLSPDDYHWAEKRGDTNGRSLIYSLAATLLLLGRTSPQQAVMAGALYFFFRRVIPVKNPRLHHGSCADGDK